MQGGFGGRRPARRMQSARVRMRGTWRAQSTPARPGHLRFVQPPPAPAHSHASQLQRTTAGLPRPSHRWGLACTAAARVQFRSQPAAVPTWAGGCCPHATPRWAFQTVSLQDAKLLSTAGEHCLGQRLLCSQCCALGRGPGSAAAAAVSARRTWPCLEPDPACCAGNWGEQELSCGHALASARQHLPDPVRRVPLACTGSAPAAAEGCLQ